MSGGSNPGFYHNMNNSSDNSNPNGGKKRGGTFPFGLFVFPLIFLLYFVISSGVVGGIFDAVRDIFTAEPSSYDFFTDFDDLSNDGDVFATRARLAESRCIPVKNTVIDENGIFSQSARESLESALSELYKITGVQSVVMFRHEINNAYDPSYGDVDEFMRQSYFDLFDDEGHVLFLFVLDNFDNYTSWYICGDDTAGIFDEADAQTVLNDIDFYASANDGKENSIIFAFESAASFLRTEFVEATVPESEITASSESEETVSETTVGDGDTSTSRSEPLTEKPSEDENVSYPTGAIDPGSHSAKTVLIVIFCVLFFAVLAAFAIGFAVQRHAERTKDENYDAHRESRDHSHSNENPYYNNNDSLPVRCPYCEALGALTEDGRCRYCGKKIK